MSDVIFNFAPDFWKALYINTSKSDQDAHLLQYMDVTAPARKADEENDKNSKYVSKYFVRKKDGSTVFICAKSFQAITGGF